MDDFVHIEGVTFEDLENQYRSQRLAASRGHNQEGPDGQPIKKRI